MERRLLGRTGQKSTIVTLGGAIFDDLGAGKPRREDGHAFIEHALDHGVNHIDVSPEYGDAEIELARFVREYRGNIFLACKTMKRTWKDAASDLRKSLERLQTDHFDLYQLHSLDKPEELETVLGSDGALEAILEAKRQGLVKYIGITSHRPTLIMKALKRFEFDTALLPVNCVLKAHPQPENDYEPVLAFAKKEGVGIMAMKAIARGRWPNQQRPHNTWYQPFSAQQEVDDAVRFTLSQKVTTTTSPTDIRLATVMIEAAEHFTPMDEEEQAAVLSRVSSCAPLFPTESVP